MKSELKKMNSYRIVMPSIMLAIVLLVCSISSIQVDAADVKSYAPVFNSAYYMEKYPDLKAAFGNNEAALFKHFLNCGMKEGRQGSEEFNVQAYKARYADLQAAYGDDLKAYYLHYINCGKSEGRNGKEDAAPAANQSAQPASQPAAQPVQTNTPQDEVIRLVNADRAANGGLGALTSTPELMNAAQKRATEIVTTFSHTRPDGTACFTMMDQCGVAYGWAGENIAAGQTSAAMVEQSWMNSPGHRANILNGNFKHIGVGLVKVDGGYRYYWVQMFTD